MILWWFSSLQLHQHFERSPYQTTWILLSVQSKSKGPTKMKTLDKSFYGKVDTSKIFFCKWLVTFQLVNIYIYIYIAMFLVGVDISTAISYGLRRLEPLQGLPNPEGILQTWVPWLPQTAVGLGGLGTWGSAPARAFRGEPQSNNHPTPFLTKNGVNEVIGIQKSCKTTLKKSGPPQ